MINVKGERVTLELIGNNEEVLASKTVPCHPGALTSVILAPDPYTGEVLMKLNNDLYSQTWR